MIGGTLSEQGILEGLVLGPLLFLIYMNYLDRGIESTLVKCADDTKLVGLANSLEATKVNQEDLNKFYMWGTKI